MKKPPKLSELIQEKKPIQKKNNHDFNALIIPTQLLESGIKENNSNLGDIQKASNLTILIIETFSISSPHKMADPDVDSIVVLFFSIINEKNRNRGQNANQIKNRFI